MKDPLSPTGGPVFAGRTSKDAPARQVVAEEDLAILVGDYSTAWALKLEAMGCHAAEVLVDAGIISAKVYQAAGNDWSALVEQSTSWVDGLSRADVGELLPEAQVAALLLDRVEAARLLLLDVLEPMTDGAAPPVEDLAKLLWLAAEVGALGEMIRVGMAGVPAKVQGANKARLAAREHADQWREPCLAKAIELRASSPAFGHSRLSKALLAAMDAQGGWWPADYRRGGSDRWRPGNDELMRNIKKWEDAGRLPRSSSNRRPLG